MLKSRSESWAGYMAQMGQVKHVFLVRKREQRRQSQRSRRTCKDKIKMIYTRMMWYMTAWIGFIWLRKDQWWAFVSTVVNINKRQGIP
jgi:hypothetical protein